MKIKIQYKLFFTLFLTSSLVAAGLFFYLQWSFDRGFLNYVRTQEITILKQLSEQLESYYEEENGWDFIENNHDLWQRIHRNLLPPFHKDRRPPYHPGPPRDGKRFKHHPPPGKSKNIGPRLILFGPDKNRIIGGGPLGKSLSSKPVMHPIRNKSGIIGYLGLEPASKISETGDLLFVQGQYKNFAIVTLGMVLLSILITFPVTSHLLKPIKEITKGTRKLIGGKFTTRIPVSTSDELGQLSSDFNILATTLEKNEQARRQWVADISHELRTPLSILRGEVEAMLDGIRAMKTDNLEPLHSEVLHLERLVNDLYELSMSDIGALNYKKIEVDPAGILQEAVDMFEHRFLTKGLSLSFTIQEQMTYLLLADPDRLHQLFDNLLENSLRYTDAPGKLEISMDMDDSSINIYFEDSSPAVEADTLEKIFDRLFRVDPSRSRTTQGAGLGLSICHNIVEAHQGTITAKKSVFGGLTFHIQFPKEQ